MSGYISLLNSSSSASPTVPASATGPTLILGSAVNQPPLTEIKDGTGSIVQKQNPFSDLTIMSFNHDGGLSFDLHKAFDQAVNDKNTSQANAILVQIIERLGTLGTLSCRVDIDAKKLTQDAQTVFFKLVRHNSQLVLTTLQSIYDENRAPKFDHCAFLIALMTSISKTHAGDDKTLQAIRGLGYTVVSRFRMTTHLFKWINLHINLSTLSSGKNSSQTELKEEKKSKKKSKGKSFLARAGGTGAGFRNAVSSWYLKFAKDIKTSMNLAIQIAKYSNRETFTHKDVLALVHIKMTSKKKCKCKSKEVCKCPPTKPYEHLNEIPVSSQIPLAYAVSGLTHARQTLVEGIERYEKSTKTSTDLQDIKTSFQVFAFLCAVDKAKNVNTTSETVADLIRVFRLTHEMISNTKLNELPILNALLTVQGYTQTELWKYRVGFATEHNFTSDQIKTYIPSVEEKEEKGNLANSIKIGMPMTALMRSLNRFTISGLLDSLKNPQATSLTTAIASQFRSQDIIQKALLHPINVFNAWATYSRGSGIKGSQVWTPIKELSDALIDASELAYKNVPPIDCAFAFFCDCSGSMSQNGSCSGMPALTALDVEALLLKTIFSASANHLIKSNNQTANYLVGYFSGCSPVSRNIIVQTIPDDSVIATKSAPFKEITTQLSSKSSFTEVKTALGNGNHMGMTDIGSAFWYVISKLKNSLQQVHEKNPMFSKKTLFQLPGFAELIVIVTDNDVNSGDQPMDVFNLYRSFVARGFEMIPLDKDGKTSDPKKLYETYQPRLVVVATQGTEVTVGDPNDPMILNVSGFDSTAPSMITSFIAKTNKQNQNQNQDDDIADDD